MANKRTTKSCYPSLYSPSKWVSASQYITELICLRAAKKDNHDLPVKFWNLPKWRKYYQFQIVICNRLLKTYKAKSILAALKDDKGKYIYSLQAPWLKPLIEQYKDIKSIEIPVDTLTSTTRVAKLKEGLLSHQRPTFKKKSLFNRLEGLE